MLRVDPERGLRAVDGSNQFKDAFTNYWTKIRVQGRAMVP
jgi:hypothetical protein